MSVSVTLRGVTYTLAQDGDQDYGAYMTTLINALVGACNNSPLATNSVQYDAVVSTDSTKRTHATLEAVIADAAITAGMNVLIDSVSYSQLNQLVISKSLNIFGLGNSEFSAAATFGADALISITADNVKLINLKLTAGGAATHAIEIDATASGIVLCCEISGAFATADINNLATAEAITGYISKTSGNYLLPLSTPGANSALSNLSSPTAINEDLVYDADNTYDFCSDATEAKAIWTHKVSHNDTIDNDLTIETTNNDGNIVLSPHGSGTVQVTKSIQNLTQDLTLEAVTANKDVILKVPSTGAPKTDVGGTEYNLSYGVQIQDYTVVGNVGDASQQMAGYTSWTIAELEHFFGAGKIYSYNKFATGALGTDTNGAYDYTMGAGGKAPSDGIGIMGVAGTAISFDGGDYATNATKLDNMTTIFSGAGKGFVHSFWVIAPTDGQPASTNFIFWKLNSAANDRYYCDLETSGRIGVFTKGNSATEKSCLSTTVLPNGANTIWTHVVVCWDTTYGLRLYINRVNEATDSTATTLMVDGTTTDFFVGAQDSTPTGPFTGRIAQEIIINKVAEQRDIDILFATTRPEPAALTGKEYTVTAKIRPEADTKYEYQKECPVLAKYSSKVFIPGRSFGEADTVKLLAEVM